MHYSKRNLGEKVKLTLPWRTTSAGMNQEKPICSLLSRHCKKYSAPTISYTKQQCMNVICIQEFHKKQSKKDIFFHLL